MDERDDDKWDNLVWVSWNDSGRSIEVELNGSVCKGTLEIADTEYIDGGEEVPLFEVLLTDGRRVPFNRAGRWRFA